MRMCFRRSVELNLFSVICSVGMMDMGIFQLPLRGDQVTVCMCLWFQEPHEGPATAGGISLGAGSYFDQ